MKYSQQTLRDIDRSYADIKRKVQLNNIISKGVQSVIIDKQMPVDLLDTRNVTDIENDEFARKALLNEYCNKLLPSGQVYEFQKKLTDDGLVKFFLNNFPKIDKEAKMYRKLDPLVLFNLTKRLSNVAEQELNLITNENNKEAKMTSIDGLLEDILTNMESIQQLTYDPRLKVDYTDKMLKIEALIETMKQVNDKVGFLQNVFQSNYPSIIQGLSAVSQNTAPPTSPSQTMSSNPDPNGLLGSISQNSLMSALQLQSASPPQTPQQTQPAPIQTSRSKRKSNSGLKLNNDLATFTDQDYQILQDLITDIDYTERKYANYLSKLTNDEIKANELVQMGSKKDIHQGFLQKLEEINQKRLREERQRKENEARQIRDQEKEKERLEADAKIVKKARQDMLDQLLDQYSELDAYKQSLSTMTRPDIQSLGSFLKTNYGARIDLRKKDSMLIAIIGLFLDYKMQELDKKIKSL